MFQSISGALAGPLRDGEPESYSVADRIARSLLDVDIPAIAGVEFGVRAAPARIVGGDYLDIVVRPQASNSFVFAIGDASGKSLPAALKAMMLKYLIRGLVRVLGDDVAEIMRHVNDVVCEDIETDSFITLNLGILSDDRRTVTFAVAGHDPALIWRAANESVDELEPGGLLLGFSKFISYRAQSVPVAPGDVIVLYTDGFTEAKSPEGEQFTLVRVRESLERHAKKPAQEIADALFDDVEKYAALTLNDDTTIVVVRVVD